ncbi:MAG: divalent metal cation transporter [Nitrospirae bacterium]|nr:MAG: divalent metal cation transporter [Nitrospirota bacterium]
MKKTPHSPSLGAKEILKYIGPGFLVTVGFIDPGNWAANIAAGSQYGYSLLWMVTLSTAMLILLQHNAAHLGIATGLCISEAATKFLPKWISTAFLVSAMLASVSTALAEILGGAIGLKMLFNLPLNIGAVLTSIFTLTMLLTNSYRKIEKWIIGFVSLIGLSFLFELSLVNLNWLDAGKGWVVPSMPAGSLPIIMSVLGAVVMPHNLFLHSEVIQSRQWNLESEETVKRQLKYEFLDTLAAMLTGWAINSSMILVAAAVFFNSGTVVTELQQAQETLRPLIGSSASIVFAFALLMAGLSSSITAGMAGGSIYAGIFMEPFDLKDSHSKTGVLLTILGGLFVIFFLTDPFQGIIWSQILLSVQLPLSILGLIFLTSSKKVMGGFANSLKDNIMLWLTAIIVSGLNIALLVQFIRN